MTLLNRSGIFSAAIMAAFVVMFATHAQARQGIPGGAQEPKGPPMVTVAALQPFVPAMEGWTKAKSGGNRVVISEQAGYTFADTTFTKNDMNLRVMVADTAATEDCLISLATMVTTLPEDYSDEVPPATTIKRLTVNGMPAAYRWDNEKKEGEYTVVVAGRFVVKVETTKADALETLRAVIDSVDLAKLATLKPGK